LSDNCCAFPYKISLFFEGADCFIVVESETLVYLHPRRQNKEEKERGLLLTIGLDSFF